jgi:hypothetical protein
LGQDCIQSKLGTVSLERRPSFVLEEKFHNPRRMEIGIEADDCFGERGRQKMSGRSGAGDCSGKSRFAGIEE